MLARRVLAGRMFAAAAVMMSTRRRCGSAFFESPIDFFNTSPVVFDNGLDVGDAIHFHFEVIDLSHELMETLNLGVRPSHDVARPVVLHLRKHLRLARQAHEALLDAAHDAIKVPGQRRQRRAVQHQHPVAAGSTGSPRAAGPQLRMRLAQDLELVRAQLRTQLLLCHDRRHGDGIFGVVCARARASARARQERLSSVTKCLAQ